MSNELAAAIERIDRALTRIEHRASRSDDSRYQRLRARTQAALGELDAVIARLGAGGRS